MIKTAVNRKGLAKQSTKKKDDVSSPPARRFLIRNNLSYELQILLLLFFVMMHCFALFPYTQKSQPMHFLTLVNIVLSIYFIFLLFLINNNLLKLLNIVLLGLFFGVYIILTLLSGAFCGELGCMLNFPWIYLGPFFAKTGTVLIVIGLLFINIVEYGDITKLLSITEKKK